MSGSSDGMGGFNPFGFLGSMLGIGGSSQNPLLSQGINIAGQAQQALKNAAFGGSANPLITGGQFPNAPLTTAGMNAQSLASAIPQLNPFAGVQPAPPPGQVTSPGQAGQNAQAMAQLQQMGQGTGPFAPGAPQMPGQPNPYQVAAQSTADVLGNILKGQQRGVPSHAPELRGSNPVPVTGVLPSTIPAPAAAPMSPLQKYALMLRGLQG